MGVRSGYIVTYSYLKNVHCVTLGGQVSIRGFAGLTECLPKNPLKVQIPDLTWIFVAIKNITNHFQMSLYQSS